MNDVRACVLTRCVRLNVSEGPGAGGSNGYAGYPSPSGLARHYEFDVQVEDVPDATTTYVMDIKRIDDAVRRCVLPVLLRAMDAQARVVEPADLLLRELAPALVRELGSTMSSVRWRLTPFYSLECRMKTPEEVLLRQKFDFAASHRLHVPALSDEENRRLFGKCNSMRGHGHNYQLEACVRIPAATARAGTTFPLTALESACDRAILSKFDHKYLNEDCPEFDVRRGGVNPSVENIAQVIHALLDDELRRSAPELRLHHVTVWETDRTCATYPAQG